MGNNATIPKASLHGDPAVFSGLDHWVPNWNQGPAVIKWRHCWGGGGHWTLETWLSVPRRRRQGLARVAFLLSFLHNLGDHLEDEGAVAMGGRGRKEKKNSQCYASIGRPAERGMPPVLSVPSTPSSHIARGPVGLCGNDVGVTNGPLFSGPFFSHSCVKHSCWGTMKAASGRQPVPRAQRTEFTRRPLFPSPPSKVCVCPQ